MKCSLGISNFLEEISSLSHSVVFLCFFALIAEEGFLIRWVDSRESSLLRRVEREKGESTLDQNKMSGTPDVVETGRILWEVGRGLSKPGPVVFLVPTE